MITLITGRPGHGKSLLAVSKVPEWFAGRDIYYYAIKDLKLPWLPLPDPFKWYELPDGAVVVIDEAQKIFPVRAASFPVPETCRQMETHRHKGFDLVLLTQDALLLDVHVRRLVGRHIHLQRNFGIEGAGVVQWDRLGDPGDKLDKMAATQWVFRYPKASYQLYHSAEIHTVKRSIPLKFWLLGVAVLAAVATVLGGVDAIKSLAGVASPAVPAVKADDVQSKPPAPKTIKRVAEQEARANGTVETRAEFVAKFNPRLNDLPWSAPVFDQLARPIVAPVVSGCVEGASRCRCYSQQGTPLVQISETFCREFVKNGGFDIFAGAHSIRASKVEAPSPEKK